MHLQTDGRMTEDVEPSAAGPTCRHDRAQRGIIPWLVAVGILLVIAIAAGTAIAVGNFRQRALDNSKRELENTVLLLQHHFDQQFEELRRIQKNLNTQLMTTNIVTPESFAGTMASAEAHQMLKSSVGDEFTSDLAIFDANGRLINWSTSWPPPDYDITHRDYFGLIKAQTAADEEIVQPVWGQTTGTWNTLFARRVSGPNGAFLGVLVLRVQPALIEKFFASVSLGENAAVSMFHRNGTLLARYPRVEGLTGQVFKTGAFLEHLRFSDGPATIRSISPIDHTDRLGSMRPLREFPIVLIATASVDGILTDWYNQTRFLVMLATASSLLLAGLLFLVIRHIRRQGNSARRELMLEKNRLATAVDNMNQGLLLFDADARVVVCNQRYLDMYGMSAHNVVPGMSLHDVIRNRMETGSFTGDLDAYVEDVMRDVGRSNMQCLQTADGRSIQVLSQPVAGGGWVATHEDITERHRTEKRIAHLAHYDGLTDLPNRTLFRSRLENELTRITHDAQCAILYIDIDEFKGINDSLGHPVGDALLKELARRLVSCVHSSDIVARLGGDEFAVVKNHIRARSDITDLVARIYTAIREPFECLGHRLLTDASIGIAIAPRDGADLDELLKNADLAMYSAKSEGRRTFRFFEAGMNARAKARRMLELDLREVVADGNFTAGGFDIHYQPVLDLRDDSIIGCEALLRWHHPQRGMISPADFIPVAEDIGVINQLGEWVLTTACQEATHWPDNIRIAVNVSPAQFRGATLPLKVAAALATSGLSARRLELEITEAVLIRDDDTALQIMQSLHDIGVRIALDDFGTGYSSLSYLQRFPFDKIKIDRSFVTDIAEPQGSSSIVQAVVNIAASRQMTTTAEGVETMPQKELLRALGCTEMQGYLFSQPKPAREIRELLAPKIKRAGAAA